MAVNLQRRRVLLQNARVHQADLGGEGHGFKLVVRDVDEGAVGIRVQALELGAHLLTQLRVQVAQRLIHEEHLRAGREGAGDGDALLLAAGKLGGVALFKLLDLEQGEQLVHAPADARLIPLEHLQTEGDVFIHRHVRPERVVLEQKADVAFVRRQVDALFGIENRHAVDQNPAAGRRFKPGDHAQGGRFAAAGGAEQGDEAAILNLQIQILHGDEFVKALGDVLQNNFRHDVSLRCLCQRMRPSACW